MMLDYGRLFGTKQAPLGVVLIYYKHNLVFYNLCCLADVSAYAAFLHALSPLKFFSRYFLAAFVSSPMKPNLSSQHLKA